MSDVNGWKNHETWLTNLHLSEMGINDLDTFWNYVGYTFSLSANDTAMEQITIVAEELRDFVNEHLMDCIPKTGFNAFLADIVAGALSNVDYREIAANFLAMNETEIPSRKGGI